MSVDEKDDFTPRKKAQIDALIKNYELTVKSYEEQLKFLYGVPLVVGAISGIALKGFDLSGIQLIGYGLIPIFILTAFWEKVLRELNKLSSYRIYLENQINNCFNSEIFIYGIRNKVVEEQERQSRKCNYGVNIFVVFIFTLLIGFFGKEFPLVIVICGILFLILMCRWIHNTEKDFDHLWYSKDIIPSNVEEEV